MEFDQFKVGAIVGGRFQKEYLIADISAEKKIVFLRDTCQISDEVEVPETAFEEYFVLPNPLAGEKNMLELFEKEHNDLLRLESAYLLWKEMSFGDAKKEPSELMIMLLNFSRGFIWVMMMILLFILAVKSLAPLLVMLLVLLFIGNLFLKKVLRRYN